MKGLRANIFKHRHRSGDGKANFSYRTDEVTLVSSDDYKFVGILEVTWNCPVAMIIKHPLQYDLLVACPVKNGKPDMQARGECFIYTSDSRFPSEHPIPLYDRIE